MAKDREERKRKIYTKRRIACTVRTLGARAPNLTKKRKSRGKLAQRQSEPKNYTFELLFIIYTLIATDIQNVNEQFVNIYYVANAFDRLRPLPTLQSHIEHYYRMAAVGAISPFHYFVHVLLPIRWSFPREIGL